MKEHNYDFSVPNRQSIFAIIIIILKTFQLVIKQIFPLLLILLIGKSLQKPSYLLLVVIAVSCLTLIISIIQYFKTYFYISGNELIVHKGILRKSKISIPFDRIQSVHFEQNMIQQICNVTQLKIETAGSDKTEFVFHAIENARAHALRNYISSHKTLANPVDDTDFSSVQGSTAQDKILVLDIVDQIKIGITENHIKSAGLIFVFLYWIFEKIQDVGIDMESYPEEVSEWNWTFNIVITLVIFLFIISLIISVVKTFLINYELILFRTGNGFKLIKGLFNKKEISVSDNKLQLISWSNNVLKGWLGINDLYLSQASGHQWSAKQSIKIPGCGSQQINKIIDQVFGSIAFEEVQYTGTDKKWFIRFAVIVSGLAVMLSTLLLIGNYTQMIWITCVISGYFILERFLAYRRIRYGYNTDVFFLKGGKWGKKTSILPIYKIQGCKIKQSPYQRKHNLCSITLFTASGSVSVPYIPLPSGQTMADYFLFKIETEQINWL